MEKTVKLQNTWHKVFNGIIPWKFINVSENNVKLYKRNGFVEVTQKMLDKVEQQKALAKQEKANQKWEKAKEVKAKKQADEQENLDKEYEEKANDGEESNVDEFEKELDGKVEAKAPKGTAKPKAKWTK